MKISLIENYSKENLEEILPVKYLNELVVSAPSVSHMLIYRADDEVNGAVGAAVYLIYKGTKRLAILKYIFVDEEYRGRGIGRDLLLMAQKNIAKLGYREIRVMIDEDEEYSGFFKKCRFKKSEQYYIADFMIGDIKATLSPDVLAKFNPIMDKVRTISQLTDKNIKEMLTLLGRESGDVDISKFNDKLSGFFVVNNKLTSLLLMNNYGSQYIYSVDMEIEDSPASQYALPAMFFSIYNRIKDEYDEDTMVEFIITNKKNLDAISQFFGKPMNAYQEECLSLDI